MLRSIAFLLFIVFSQSLQAQDQLSQNKVEKLYHRGTELIAHSNFGAAREVFSEFLTLATPTDSRRSEAEYYVAFAALSLGHKDGEKLIDNFIDNNQSSPKASTAYYDLANFFYGEGNYTKAVQYFKKVNFPALTTDQQNQGHFKLGYSYFNQKKLDEALEQFNFMKRQSSAYSPAANYYAGFIEYSKGLYEEALFDLKKAEGNPSYANIVPYLITGIYYKQKRFDTVIEYAGTLKGRTDLSNASDISMLVAEAYYYKGDFKKAIEAYQKYFDNNAKAETGLLFRAGYANYVSGNTEKGIEYLDKAAATKDTVSYYASYYLGILHLKKGNKPLALNSFDYAKNNPKDKKLAEESSFQFAKVSYDAGKPDQAITEFERFLKAYPSSPRTTEVRELLAQAYVNGNNFNKAIEYIELLPSRNQYINQAYQKATYLKGSELFNKEQYPEAVEYFTKSLEQPIDPNYVALASFWNGESYSHSNQYEDAVTNYQKVISLGSSVDPEILLKTRYGLGYAHFNVKAYDKALFNFKDFSNKGNKSTPNYADGLIRLADCYYVSKQYDDAIATYSRARTIGSPDNDYVLLQSGVIYGFQQKYTDGRAQFSELIKSYPKSQYRDDAMFERARFEIEQGNHQAAIEGLSQLIREANSSFLPYAYLWRAASNYNLKQYDKSINDYQAVIKQFPTHQAAREALLPLQEALNAGGRSDDFQEYADKVTKANPESKELESVVFAGAMNLYNAQQYQKAINGFGSFLASYPQSAQTQEVKYYMAESHYRLQEFDKALPLYVDLSSDKNFSMGSRVVGRMGEIQFKQGKYEQAIPSFHRLEKLAANKKDQYNAWAGLMESFYLLAQYDSADMYARTILEKGNINAGAQNKASLYLGKTAMAKGDFETAKDEFLNTLNAARDEYGAEAKYLLAQIFFQKKEYKQCSETLYSLNNDFSAYEDWVGRSFLLLADNYAAQDDVFNARATLQSLDKFPKQFVKDEARKKLKELEQREAEKQKQVEADTLDK